MYIPRVNEVHDQAALLSFMARFNFATLVTIAAGLPCASHLPWEVDAACVPHGKLRGHLARPNPQWRHFQAGQEVLVIFQGAHGYISPSWYAVAQPAVPTWNYMVAHVYGVPQIIEEPAAVYRHLRTLVQEHEGSIDSQWRLDEGYMQKLARGVVAFEIEITRLEGKFKLSQNRSVEDRRGVIAALGASSYAGDRALAQAMEEHT